jgi:Na+:H+ antiporter, NhaA family
MHDRVEDEGLISKRPQPPSQAVSGLLLLLCALLALAWANSPWRASYHAFWHQSVGPASLQHLVNDGLMALFFLLVGMEIKFELVRGALASWQSAALPVVGAVGGMLLPALLYSVIAAGSESASGWGIPMATDIAFALGVVALLGPRVPAGLRVFLAALAIADDLGAVLVIALFYSPQLAWDAAGIALLVVALLATYGRRRAPSIWPFLLGGGVLWLAVARSGIHASIAGVLLAAVIPTHGTVSVQRRLEAWLLRPVILVIVPLFALANAGVTLPSELVAWRDPGVAATVIGLAIGKPLGITGAAWLAVRLRMAQLPSDADWGRLMGVAALGGIGFTMSLFIGTLAFGDGARLDAAKIGVLSGSLIAGLLGTLILMRAPQQRPPG